MNLHRCAFNLHGYYYPLDFREFLNQELLPLYCNHSNNVNYITVESDADKFLVENINAMDTKAASIPANSNARFEDQKFELPHDMPQVSCFY